ncbi:DUF2293 domain-containing protein [candidate division KSB1 bacterium]|nr:DUF2293 domain-containing protein [candidate division KSB1 bacterium]
MPKNDDILVFWIRKDTTCGECGKELWHGSCVFLEKDKGALCLECSDLDHLLFLPRGDAALTRRARKYSTLSAVVLEWSRTRKRYERQGLLVEEEALEKAEQECLADADARERRRERAAERRAELDEQFVKEFAARIRELYTGCPEGREHVIAEHACRKYSGRVGRSAAAKAFNEEAIRLAVIAHIRHAETDYDAILAESFDRGYARMMVEAEVEEVLEKWQND